MITIICLICHNQTALGKHKTFLVVHNILLRAPATIITLPLSHPHFTSVSFHLRVFVVLQFNLCYCTHQFSLLNQHRQHITLNHMLHLNVCFFPSGNCIVALQAQVLQQPEFLDIQAKVNIHSAIDIIFKVQDVLPITGSYCVKISQQSWCTKPKMYTEETAQ